MVGTSYISKFDEYYDEISKSMDDLGINAWKTLL